MSKSRGVGLRGALVACVIAAGVTASTRASAFCGFYVSGADAKLFNNATQVVMMREGTRTVLSMQNDYEGPPENFAMVVPVPVVLQKENVKTLPKEIFDKIDKLTAPRLVEYWEQDPCGGGYYGGFGGMAAPMAQAKAARASAGPAMDLGVTVEARFDVGEYDVVILSAKDSGGLDTWLKQESYKIPNGAEPFLRPYVAQGSKFFVAKVDPKRVTFEKGRAALSPLRFHYDSTDFTLPVRLGLINSRGTQDLIVNILASQRYEPVNYPSVTIPTNLDLAQGSKEHFGRFYTALFDRTLEKNPKAVVTEYSWDASSCDPCPGPAMYPQDFAELGADALPPPPGSPPPTQTPRAAVGVVTGTATPATQKLIPTRYLNAVQTCWATSQNGAQKQKPKPGKIDVKVAWAEGGKVTDASIGKNDTGDAELATCVKTAFEGGIMTPEAGSLAITYDLAMSEQRQMQYRSWTITRLHARYTKESLGEDLVFKAAEPISGGREVTGDKGALEHGSTKASMNNFQGRYAIRHPWVGPITCKEPRRGVWGGPWHDLAQSERMQSGPTAAEKVAFAPRGGVTLANFVRTDVPELGVTAGKGPLPLTGLPAPSGSASGNGASGESTPSASSGGSEKAGRSGCGACATTSTSDTSGSLAVLGGVLALAGALARRVARSRSRSRA